MSVAGLLDAMRSTYTPATRLVWMCLENHATPIGRCWSISLADLAEELTLNRDTISRSLEDLQRDGVIKIIRHRRAPSVYHMLRTYPCKKSENVESREAEERARGPVLMSEIPISSEPLKPEIPMSDAGKSDFKSGVDAGNSDHSESTSKTPPESTSSAVASQPPPVVPFPDIRKQLWDEGRAILLRLTGQGSGPAGRDIGAWLKLAGENHAVVLDALRAAERERPSGSLFAWMKRAVEKRTELKFRDGAVELAYRRGLLTPEHRQSRRQELTLDTSAFDGEAARGV